MPELNAPALPSNLDIGSLSFHLRSLNLSILVVAILIVCNHKWAADWKQRHCTLTWQKIVSHKEAFDLQEELLT